MSVILEMEALIGSVVQDPQIVKKVVREILNRFGGDTIYIKARDYRHRNQHIVELINAGASIEAVARRYHLTRRSINRIVSAAKDNR